MLTLVIDSATEACSVALFDGGKLVAGEYRLLGRGHAEQLVPMIAALPGKGRAARIAVALGPGSFTGMRVGIAAARALALAWQAELAGYPTLALVAAMARARRGAQPVRVAMRAGHGEWFVQGFTADGAAVDAVLSAAPEIAAGASEHLVAGSEAQALVTARGVGEALELLSDAREFALLDAGWLSAQVMPVYGRGPDAKLPPTPPLAAS